MLLELPYGKEKMTAELPEGFAADFILQSDSHNLTDPEKSFRESLENPIGSPALKQMLPEKGKILLMISDITRKDNKKEILKYLQSFLKESAFPDERVDILFCQGTHRQMTQTEIEQSTGEEFIKNHTVYQHNCDGPVREIGITSRGTPVTLNSILWNYSLLIPVTGIVHHYFAGFGGGRKMLAPGAAGRITIQKSHELVFMPEEQGGKRRPGIESAKLKGNAVHEDFCESVKMIDIPIFLISSIKGSHAGSFLGFWSGDIFKAHEKGCEAYLKHRAIHFNKPYDLIISSSGGFPLDANLVQTQKGLDNAFHMVKPGGSIIHLSECPDGLGGEGLEEWIAVQELDELRRKLMKHYKIYGQTVYAIKEKALQASIIFISRLSDNTIKQLQMIPAPNLKEALNKVLPGLPENPSIGVLPEASGILPFHSVQL